MRAVRTTELWIVHEGLNHISQPPGLELGWIGLVGHFQRDFVPTKKPTYPQSPVADVSATSASFAEIEEGRDYQELLHLAEADPAPPPAARTDAVPEPHTRPSKSAPRWMRWFKSKSRQQKRETARWAALEGKDPPLWMAPGIRRGDPPRKSGTPKEFCLWRKGTLRHPPTLESS